MSKQNQKGFGAVEAILIFVIIGALVGVGWWVWSRGKKTNDSSNQIDSQAQPIEQVTESQDNSDTSNERAEDYYTIDLSGSKKPDKKEVKYSDFFIRNSGGSAVEYDKSKSKFYYGDIDFNKSTDNDIKIINTKELKKHTSSSDGTPIYKFEHGDADTYKDYYLIDLKNGKILQIAFFYNGNNSDPVNDPPEYKSMTEINAQRAKDLKAVKTFRFAQ